MLSCENICACVPVGIPVYVYAHRGQKRVSDPPPPNYPLPIHFEARSLSEPETHGFSPPIRLEAIMPQQSTGVTEILNAWLAL